MATAAEINTAITAINESGQSFVVDGVQYSAGNLKTLYQMYQDALEQEARTSGARPMMRGVKLSAMGY